LFSLFILEIIIATHGSSQDLNFGLLVDTLGKAITESKDWLVSIKSLQLFHRVIQEGSEEFMETVLRHNVNKVLNMSGWKDRLTAEAMEQSPFVRQYARYIEERVVLYRNVQIKQLDPQMQLPIYTTAKFHEEELFRLIAALQRVTEEILECYHLLSTKESRLGNAATVGAFNLLIDDALSLFKLLSDANLKLLDTYFDMAKPNAKTALELYQRHCRQSQELLEMLKFAKKSGVSRRNIPLLKATPDTILEAMKEYLGEEGLNSSGASARNRSSNRYIDDEEAPTMNLSDMLTPQELEMIKDSVSPSSRSDEEYTNSSSYTDDISPRANKQAPRRSSKIDPSKIKAPPTSPPKTSTSPSMLEFDVPPPMQHSNSNNNMMNFDNFFGHAPPQQQQQPQQPFMTNNNTRQYSPPNQAYSPQYQNPPMLRGPSNPMLVPQNQQYYAPNPQQQQFHPHNPMNRVPSNPVMNQQAPPMNRQQEMIMRQHQFKQQYVQDKSNPYAQPPYQQQQQQQQQPPQQQQQQQAEFNPFDDPFADAPMNPQQAKRVANDNVLNSFHFN
jgi:hypothetical protein